MTKIAIRSMDPYFFGHIDGLPPYDTLVPESTLEEAIVLARKIGRSELTWIAEAGSTREINTVGVRCEYCREYIERLPENCRR